MTTIATFIIRAIPASELDAIRGTGMDVSGKPIQTLTDAIDEPLRCCLRNARSGENVILFGYEPPLPGDASPYREIGAVLAHADDCAAPAIFNAYPGDWQGRPQVLRAYDARGWIHPSSTTHDGTDPEAALARVLAEPGVARVHSRNVVYGCFMFAATSAP
jgi:hypothetical protein